MNTLYRFSTTVLGKKVIIRISNKLDYRARRDKSDTIFVYKTNGDSSKEIGRNSITTGYIATTNAARSFYSIIK